MSYRLAWIAALLSLTAFAAHGEEQDHALDRDKTGVRWIHPYKKTRAEAKTRHQLMLMVPIAGGATRQEAADRCPGARLRRTHLNGTSPFGCFSPLGAALKSLPALVAAPQGPRWQDSPRRE